MFETLFTDVLNPEHELLRAGRLIDWDGLHEALSVYYSPVGRHGKSIRLMVGIHILKHRYNCSDDRAVEMLHENAYWQCFCGFNAFQGGQILDSTSMVKFRNRIGTEGMKRIEAVLLHAWSEMGLVKTRRVAVDTTPQAKNIAYPTDADLLHRIKEKIVKQIARVREEVTLRKSFRTFRRTGKLILLGIKKFHRANPEARQEAIGKLKEMTDRVVKQAAGVVNTLYSRGHQASGRQLNRLVSLGKRIIAQTEEVIQGKKPTQRLYSLHEKDVAVIKKGKSFPACEFGSLVSLAKNDDGLILSHQEYQRNMSDVKTLGQVLSGIKRNTGHCPDDVTADRGFDQSLKNRRTAGGDGGQNGWRFPRRGNIPIQTARNPGSARHSSSG